VQEGCGWERRRRLFERRYDPGRGCILDARSIRDSGDSGHLCLHMLQSGQSRGGLVIDRNQQELRVRHRHWL
jgi:hypothetical protein